MTHLCPSCETATEYQVFSGGREWYCPNDKCGNSGMYTSDEEKPPRVALMGQPGGFEELRHQMREHFKQHPAYQTINTVPRDQYGMWCQHGHHIFVVDPADNGPYPGTVPADPWPCEHCTLEGVLADMEAEAQEWSDQG